MVFFELRWNYSPLKEKAVLLPDGLFIDLLASRQTASEFFIDIKRNLLLMRAVRRSWASQRFIVSLRSIPPQSFSGLELSFST
jgi:hypothetical protein